MVIDIVHMTSLKNTQRKSKNMTLNMCCTLDTNTLCWACAYKDSTGKRRLVPWIQCDVEYIPSFNKSMYSVLPCLTSGSHFGEKNEERVLCTMINESFSHWMQLEKFEEIFNNCREGIETSRLDEELFGDFGAKRQRCIVICDGFYGTTVNNTFPNQPYYIYAAQKKGVRSDDSATWANAFSETDGWKGFKVLKLAGVFKTYIKAGIVRHSFIIFGKPSNNVMSWLNFSNIPIHINDEEECRAWLDTNITTHAAIQRLKNLISQEGTLRWHPVSTIVKDVLERSADCIKEIKLEEEKKNNQTSFMASCLKKGSAVSNKRKCLDNKDTNIKKIK